ncbi:MAG: hypothetical protein U0350_34895 [Caldilineaceae bacterium]
MSLMLSSPDVVEQELAELQVNIQHSLRALNDLETIHRHFSDFQQTYEQIKGFLEVAQLSLSEIQQKTRTTLDEIQQQRQALQLSFDSLTNQNERRWKEFQTSWQKVQSEATDVQNQARKAYTELAQQKQLVSTELAQQKQLVNQTLQALSTQQVGKEQALQAVTLKVHDLLTATNQIRNEASERFSDTKVKLADFSAQLSQLQARIDQQGNEWLGQVGFLKRNLETQINVQKEQTTSANEQMNKLYAQLDTFTAAITTQLDQTKKAEQALVAELTNIKSNFTRRLRFSNTVALIALLVSLGLIAYIVAFQFSGIVLRLI